ncbi:unnamed protein product [Heterobilharzia americana]|nr:unnamed protein product [Heterobilharzia americana]
MPIYGLAIVVIVALFWCGSEFTFCLRNVSKTALKAQVKEMFLHAYYSYKNNAFPADELMPLSCRGRYRWEGINRGDIDDALGNFSLTMLDGLDSLFLVGELDEFDSAVKSVVETVRFDADVDVSVFETNIRVLGGLLGAHIAAVSIKANSNSRMIWYNDDLLKMAIDIGNRLLPAFDTPTGIPYPRINLRYGSAGLKKHEEHTCTACAGTMILEFAALSRLTGNPIFEEKAVKAMAFLWKQRNRYSDLVGRVINVRNGDWVRQESGVGAGIDSYYEYLLKAYILLGEPVYLHRFQTHYEAVNRYVGGPHSAEFPFLFLDVHMHRPAQRARTFMDALLAFWPGIQVLTGDVKRAVALHELLYLIHKRNKLLPEAFTPDFNVHWGQHLLRPELIESTYLLYRATQDPYYLQVGEQIVNDLEKYTRVPCGFAAIKDVRTMEHEDQFDSFVLAETFKYLYLLFAEPSDIPINLDDYIFTTEAHLLPLSLSRQRYPTDVSINTIVNRSQEINSMPSSMSSASSVSTPNHHGDRDVKIERLLHKAAQCIAVGYEKRRTRNTVQCMLNTSTMNSDTSSNSINDDSTSSSNSGDSRVSQHLDLTTCDISETPGLSYSRYINRSPKCHNASMKTLSKSHIWRIIDTIRQPLRQIAINLDHSVVSDYTNKQGKMMFQQSSLPLKAIDFQPDNIEHLNTLKRMGISLTFSQDGRITLTHHHNAAEEADLATAGVMFIQELITLTNKKQSINGLTVENRYVVVINAPSYGFIRFSACPAHFGIFPGEEIQGEQQDEERSQAINTFDKEIGQQSTATLLSSSSVNSSETRKATWQPLVGPVRVVDPIDACKPITNDSYAYPSDSLSWNQNPTEIGINSPSSIEIMLQSKGPISGSIGIVRRGGCVFVEKAYHLAQAGAIGVIIVDNKPETSSETGPLFAMSGDTDVMSNKIRIPVVLLMGVERDKLFNLMRTHWNRTSQPMTVMLTKEYDPGESFNTAALSINTENRAITLNDSNNIEALESGYSSFELISDLYQSPFQIDKNYFIKVSDIINFSISQGDSKNFHLRYSNLSSSSPSSSSSSPVENNCQSIRDNVTTTSKLITSLWLLTFTMNAQEQSNYFIPFKDGDDKQQNNTTMASDSTIKGSPKEISNWVDLFKSTLKQIEINNECHHLVLLLFKSHYIKSVQLIHLIIQIKQFIYQLNIIK